MKHFSSSPSRRAFTLIELLVVIAIIAILAAILFPVFAQAKAAAKTSTSTSNLKQLALSTQMYTNDFDDNTPMAFWNIWPTPVGGTWDTAIQPYLGQKVGSDQAAGILESPADPVARVDSGNPARKVGRRSYAAMGNFNIWEDIGPFKKYVANNLGGNPSAWGYPGRSMSEFEDPAGTGLITEHYMATNFLGEGSGFQVNKAFTNSSAWCSWDYAGQDLKGWSGNNPIVHKEAVHRGKWVYSFADGHVKVMDPKATVGRSNNGDTCLPEGIWTIKAGD